MNNQKLVVKNIFSQIGMNIFKGKGILNVSIPVNVMADKSLLLLNLMAHTSTKYFLDKACNFIDP